MWMRGGRTKGTNFAVWERDELITEDELNGSEVYGFRGWHAMGKIIGYKA